MGSKDYIVSSEALQDIFKRGETGGIDAVVVGQQELHGRCSASSFVLLLHDAIVRAGYYFAEESPRVTLTSALATRWMVSSDCRSTG